MKHESTVRFTIHFENICGTVWPNDIEWNGLLAFQVGTNQVLKTSTPNCAFKCQAKTRIANVSIVIALRGWRLECLDRIQRICFIFYFIAVDGALVNSMLLHQGQEITEVTSVRYTKSSFYTYFSSTWSDTSICLTSASWTLTVLLHPSLLQVYFLLSKSNMYIWSQVAHMPRLGSAWDSIWVVCLCPTEQRVPSTQNDERWASRTA